MQRRRIFAAILFCAALFIANNSHAQAGRISSYGGANIRTVISGTNMFVQKGTKTFEIYDLSDPTNPILLGKKTFEKIKNPTSLQATGALLFLIEANARNNNHGYGHVLDFSDPKNITSNDLNTDVIHSLSVDADYIYTAGYSGLTKYYFDSKKKRLSQVTRYPYRQNHSFMSVLKDKIVIGYDKYIEVFSKPDEFESFKSIAKIVSFSPLNLVGQPFEHQGDLYLNRGYHGLWRFSLSQNKIDLVTKVFESCSSVAPIEDAWVASCYSKLQFHDKTSFQPIYTAPLAGKLIEAHSSIPNIFYHSDSYDGLNGLRVIQWNNKTAEVLKTISTVAQVTTVKAFKDLLILGVLNGPEDQGIHLVSPNGGNPKKLGSIILRNVTDFERVGNFLFVTTDGDGSDLHLYDISDPGAPVFKKSTKIHSYRDVKPKYLKASGNKIFVTLGYSIGEVAILNQDLDLLGRFSLQASSISDCGISIAIKDNFLYHADCGGSVNIYDFSDPNQVKLASALTEGVGYINGVRVVDNRLYVIDYWKGFEIYDITNPITPIHIPNTSDGRAVNTKILEISNGFGISSTGISDAMVTFWNFLNPDDPKSLGTMDFESAPLPTALATSNGLYYIAHPSNGLLVVP